MEKSIFKILILLSVFANVTTGQYSFVNYDYTNGLPLDEIKVIVEDSMGYIWLGGPLGLSRFDGRNFTHYYRDSPTDAIAGNIVYDIGVTPSGDVVVVYDDNGVSIYDHESDTFRSKNYTEEDSSDFPKHGIVFVHVANDTTAYLGANREGLYQINLNTLKTKKLPLDFIPADMIEDPEKPGGYLLTRGGLRRLNFNDFSRKKLTSAGHSNLMIINDDVWYSAYSKHISRYNLKTEKETIYPLFFKGIVRGWSMVEGNLWVGTAEGLEIIDTATTEVISILRSGDSAKDLQGSFIYDVFKDSKDRVWVSTGGGLSLYDPKKTYYERTKWLPFQSTHLSPLPNDEILCLEFYHNEIVHIDQKRNGTKFKIKSKLRGPLHTITDGGLMYVIFYNGIGIYNPNTKSIDAVSTPFTETKEKSLIQVLVRDDNWMGIYRHQDWFIAWNSSANTLDTIALGGEPRGIVDTNDGNVWIYGIGILWKYNWMEKTSSIYSLNSDEFANLSGDIVQIDEAEDGYWISTRINGIWKTSYENQKFHLEKHYTESDGLTNNNVVHSYTDENKTLFVQCRSGVFVHDKEKDRFISLGGKSEINVQTSYGLAVIDSVFHVLGYHSKSIDLRKVDKSQKVLQTVIEDIHVNGKKMDIGVKQTSFKHNENNIGISFNTFEFTDPSSIRHRYRLDTLSDWVYNEPSTSAIQLSALAAGDYLFQLSATDGSGLWTNPIEWSFAINPPYWRSWWFVLLILSLLLLLGYVLFNYRMKQLGRINNMKVQLVELEAESLRAQMNPHFVFNALNSIKSYIIKNNKEEAADYLTTFSELIRAVLRNSTRKEISLKDEIEALSLYLQIENQRLNQKFDFNIDVAEGVNAASIAFPPLIIQPFVENSIWHGFTNKKTRGLLNINIHRDKSQLIIEITDDGIGREASKKIEKSRERKRSYGIAITETRLQNIMKQADIEIEDLYDETGTSCGTKVIIHLPFKLLENQNDVKY
jgi:ligand-binding sensor domain-containing protein/two-component sensor histidine kinase